MILSFLSLLSSFCKGGIRHFKEQPRAQKIEYCVYTIDRRVPEQDTPFRWQKRHTTSFYKKALARAQILYRSGAYERVEVRKITRDEADNLCSVYEGYRIFEDKKPLFAF